MTEIKYSIPTSITTAALCLAAVIDQDQIPQENYSLPNATIKQRFWEEQYVPSNSWDDYKKIATIHTFAVTLLKDSEDIPEEFARVINEDFWEII